MTRALRVIAHGVLLLACSQHEPGSSDPGATPPLPTASAPSDGSGGVTGGGAIGGAIGGGGGASSTGADVPCTPALSPGDEFYVPCPDAGMDVAPPALTAGAGGTAAPQDAGPALDPAPDAATLPPAVFDQGLCAQQSDDCTFGHAATTVGSATCSIVGDFLSVQHEVCEICGLGTDIIDFSVAVMDCGGCMQVYREGTAIFGTPLAANACMTRAQSAGLTLTLSDPDCIDVYAYVSSGEESGSGAFVQSSDEVRVCRCDRTTDTCTTCIGGACDTPP